MNVNIRFQLLETINLCLVVGLAVDYIVHIVEGYHMSRAHHRLQRIQDTMESVGISIMSGAITTLGATLFMFFAKIIFFKQFGTCVFSIILASCIFSMFVFPAVYSICGPNGYFGSLRKLCKGRKNYKSYSQDNGGTTVENPAFQDTEGDFNKI